MRVLMVSSGWPPVTGGGAEAYVRLLTEALRGEGHTVAAVTLGIAGNDVVTAVPPPGHRLDEHRAGGRVARARFHAADVWRPAGGRAVRQAIAAFEPDVVHSHVVTGMSITALGAAARAGVPSVHTLHDYWLQCLRSTGASRNLGPCGPACSAVATWRAARLRRHGPDVYLAISHAMAARHHRLAAPALQVLHHPAATPAPAPASRNRPQSPVFGFLGQLNRNKGVETFLAAARRTASADFNFVVAGSGRLDAAVRRSGVEYRGWVDGAAKESFFADIDCLVVPSLWEEPAGLVVREAAVRGIAVIASDIGGLPEYVPPACQSLLFGPGDVAALVARLESFAGDPQRYTPDGSDVPTWEAHVAAVLGVYERAGAPRRLHEAV